MHVESSVGDIHGSIADVGLGAVFLQMVQQENTGVLTVTRGPNRIAVSLQSGDIVAAEVIPEQADLELGELLISARHLAPETFFDVLQRHAHTLEPVAHILVEAARIEPQVIYHYERLRVRELLFFILTWTDGFYKFKRSGVQRDPALQEPIRAPQFLAEARSRMEQWPEIRHALPTLNEKLYVTDDGEKLPPDLAGVDLEPNEKRVLRQIAANQSMSLREHSTHLGWELFETARSAASLIKLGYVASKPGSTFVRAPDVVRAPTNQTTMIAYVVLGAVLLFMALFFIFRDAAGPLHTPGAEDLRVIQTRAQIWRVHNALDAYLLLKGSYPADLDELVTAGMLWNSDLRYPLGKDFVYRRNGQSYTLAPPPP